MPQVTFLEVGTDESHEVFLKNISEAINTDIEEAISDEWDYAFSIPEKHLSCHVLNNTVNDDKGYKYLIQIYLYGISDTKVIEDSLNWLFEKFKKMNRYKLLLSSLRSNDVWEYIPTHLTNREEE